MKFFLRHKGAVLAGGAALLIIAMAITSFFTKEGTSPVSNAINFLFRPLQSAVGSLSDRIGNTQAALERYDALLAEHENLRAYVAEMEQKLRQTEDIAAENVELRELLGLELRKRNFQYISATIVSREASGWANTMMLSKGTEAGIEKNMPVISSAGYLVGVISETGAGWSRVMTVIDPDFGAGAKIYRTGQWSVAEGEWSLMQDNQLKLRYLSSDADVQNGDLILTSGEGGIFPSDLPIGTVVAFRDEISGQDSYAVIQPKAEMGDLTGLFVVKSFDIVE